MFTNKINQKTNFVEFPQVQEDKKAKSRLPTVVPVILYILVFKSQEMVSLRMPTLIWAVFKLLPCTGTKALAICISADS